MIFYSQETSIGLLIASLPAALSVYLFFNTEKKNAALMLLLLSALMLRLLMISLDPFLHEWDEHFHALVAKNMIAYPFKPMLFANPIVVHDVYDWSYTHIWLHKQPLFLWQMMISMKLLGVNEIAMRLPSAIMSAIGVWLIYDMARLWTDNKTIAFISALLVCFSYYTLELVSGQLSLEHNDTAFIFYMTLSFWCLLKYIHSRHQVVWAICLGAVVGCAVLNKWLTGYLVFGGWGLYLLMKHGKNMRLRHFIHPLLTFVVSIAVFLPWQIHISNAFPLESAIEYKHNTEHFFKALGHPGTWMYHLNFFPEAYHIVLFPFLLLGTGVAFYSKETDKNISFSLIFMVIVIYAFFSFLVATKMPMFTFPVSGIMMILMAIGFNFLIRAVTKKINLQSKTTHGIYSLLLPAIAFLVLKPFDIIENRSAANELRNKRLNNTTVIKQMNDSIPSNYIVLNFRAHENIDYMFYKNGTGYHFYPDSIALDSILLQGNRLAFIEYTDHQKLPGYITSKPEILILKEKFQ